MTQANKFLFEHDFRDPNGGARNLAAIEAAEQRGYARGLADGRKQASAEAEAQLAASTRRLADAAGALLALLEAERARIEEEALIFATALARKLAGAALAAEPLAALGDGVRAAFQHLLGVPHLVVRVNDRAVEAVDGLVQRIARERGFEGRLVVIGESEIAPGDGRIEWADGGLVREQARIDAAVEAALSGILSCPPHS